MNRYYGNIFDLANMIMDRYNIKSNDVVLIETENRSKTTTKYMRLLTNTGVLVVLPNTEYSFTYKYENIDTTEGKRNAINSLHDMNFKHVDIAKFIGVTTVTVSKLMKKNK